MAIVDDEPTLRLRFRLTLQRVGIPVQNFKDFEEADSFVVDCVNAKQAGRPYGVVFVDINLKTGQIANGLDLVKKIRGELNGNILIAVISTSTRREEVERAYQNGADCYIVKSGKLDTFSERMRAFKAAYLDSRADTFQVFGEEEIVGSAKLLGLSAGVLPKLRHLAKPGGSEPAAGSKAHPDSGSGTATPGE